jgi:hypothetical protein
MEKFEATLADIKVRLVKAFGDHPKHAGESYLQHLFFTLKMVVVMLFTSIALLIHGFFPFVFTKTASNNFKNMNNKLQERVAKVNESIASQKPN